MTSKRTVFGLLALQLLAFWPVGVWYVERMRDGSDEPWGILALLTVVTIAGIRRALHEPTEASVWIATVFAAIYGITANALPNLVGAGIAVLSFAVVISMVSYGRLLQPAVVALLLLSLPLIASLQFFGGFPLRFVTTYLVAAIVSIFGWDVSAEGTLLMWAGETIAVDAPCAGIKMLWSGLFLNFTFAAWRDLSLLTTWLATSLSMLAVFIGNVVRAGALFFTESGIVAAPEAAHSGIGMIVFALVAFAIVTIHTKPRWSPSCAGL